MVGLVYLTSVAGLIATSAVLHQLSLSRSSQSVLTPPAEMSLPHHQATNINSEAPAVAQRLPCCVLANKSLNRQTSVQGNGQHHSQTPSSAFSQTSVLCLWGSLLASVGHIHPETTSEVESSQAWSAVSFFCPGCLATLPPLQCGLRNTSSLFPHGSLDNHNHRALWLASNPPQAADSSYNSRLGQVLPIQLGSCPPESMLPVDKGYTLLMSG